MNAWRLLPLEAGAHGRRWAVHHWPTDGRPRGGWVYLHPFAEEMNKSRRMAACASRGLAQRGFEVLQIDLFGCGDSDGDFGDATWDLWRHDVRLATRWLRERLGGAPVGLWGLRAGCLLAADAAASANEPLDLLFWQPVLQGRSALQQFLRLKAVSGQADGAKGVVEGLRHALAQGVTVEVAGYRVGPALAAGLDAARVQPVPTARRLVWLEASTRPEPQLLPASAAALAEWRAAGVEVQACAVAGPAFWQTTEIEQAPQLLEATWQALTAPAEAMA